MLRSALLITLAALSGCASNASLDFPTVDALPEGRRQPDGVAVDPLPAAITGARSGSTSTGAPLALSPLLSDEAALSVVGQLFELSAREDLIAATRLFTERGGFIVPSAMGRSLTPALPALRERFRRLDYFQLVGKSLWRESDAEVYGYGDLETPEPGRPSRPPEMQEGDVLVRVKILVPHVGADRLFGDEADVLLRPSANRFRILLVAEEFQLP